MFKDFLAFLVVAGLSWSQVTTLVFLAFMEYLHTSGMSASNVANYLTAIRSMMIIHALDTTPLRDQRVPLFIKALKINRPLQPHLPVCMDQEALLRIISVAETLPLSFVYVPLYLLAFFSFLRISNILPHSAAQFDSSRHLCKGDLISSANSVVIIIKWSKTLQDRKKVATVTIPALGASPLCPLNALKKLLHIHPLTDDHPLFIFYKQGRPVTLTDSMARKHLKHISCLLGLPKHYTFHDFRRGGGYLGFQAWCPLARHTSPRHMVQSMCLEVYTIAPFGHFICGFHFFHSPTYVILLPLHMGCLGAPFYHVVLFTTGVTSPCLCLSP